MRAVSIFILGLMSLSCVLTQESALLIEMNQNYEFKKVVDQFRVKSDLAQTIISLAELQTDGKFSPLFDAIKNLQKFLELQRIQENKSFAEATAQHRIDVARQTKIKKVAKFHWNSDNNTLRNRLFPLRKDLIRELGSLRRQLKSLKKNLAKLILARKKDVTIFKAKSLDYIQAIAALEKALPLLNSLKSGQSFAELDIDIFAQVQSNLKRTLSRLEMGTLYTSFVESMMKSLNSKSFVDQNALNTVINLIVTQKDRLVEGLGVLKQDEVLNKQRFQLSQAEFNKAIKKTTNQISNTTRRIIQTNKKIVKVESNRKVQIAVYKKAITDLLQVNKSFVRRTTKHNKLLHEIDNEQGTIIKAIKVLNKAGIRN